MSSLANAYRPLIFKDLIGQEVMVRTISNAIKLNRVANAFLLTGPHGVGKTSAARIIAKSLNCLDKNTPDPCMNCVNCHDITASTHLDILEMDAASNTSVDDIRALLESAKYLPVSATFKVYIIDEVHMLSKSAFNALLKALEEPYHYVKFILATTESYKVPATIISRCQRFHLQRINYQQLASRIEDVANKENNKISNEAAYLIAKSADGSVRDALSILEQAISYSNDDITVEDVQKILGMSDSKKLIKLVEYIADRQASPLLKLFAELYNLGGDPIIILYDVLELLHGLSKMKVIPYDNAELLRLSEKFSLELLNRLWQALFNGIQTVKFAPNIYIAAEMILLRICHLSSLPSPGEVIGNIEPVKKLTAEQILDLCKRNNETVLLNYLTNNLRIMDINDNIITLNMVTPVNSLNEFKSRFTTCLNTWTKENWSLKIVDKLESHPVVNRVMQEFDGAKITNIKKI